MSEEEKLLEGSLYSLDSMIESTPSCLKIINSAGSLIKMNPKGLELIEAESLSSVKGADVYSIVEESHRKKFKAFNRKICGGEKGHLIFEIIGLKGTRRWMESYAAPYKLHTGEIAHIAITNDITTSVSNESEIRKQKEVLAEASRLSSLGMFASGIAHEINNPLFIISGKASLILKKVQNGNNFDHNSLIKELNDIIETSSRIEDIIHNLRDVSGSGNNAKFEIQNISNLVNKNLSLVQQRMANSGIEIKLEIPNELEVRCNSVKISQVLMNLINNSFQAIEGNSGEKWIRIKAIADSDFISLCVSDSGQGINKDVQKEMMTPFFTTKDVGEGTGLGLSISSNIMKNHNGRLYFDNDAFNTRFVMEFPNL